ncbi:Alpha/Beta hydrolase protein, partial [Piptocephalis cylindrospora]
LCGILETSKHPQPAGPRRLALICHGWMGSKNYLFQAQLAKALPFDSFRFDFSGNGESEGFLQWGHFERDIEDIDAAVQLMRQERGYSLDTMIGHSRGALSAFKYATIHPDGFRCLINVAGRQIMGKLKKSRVKELETKGYFEMEYNLRSGRRVIRATREDVASGDAWQKPFVQNLPPSVRTLTIHGTKDTVNPLSEAVSFANYAPNHTLRLLEGADHNLRGFHDTVCAETISW